jgi:hypothetical protein
MIYPKGPGDGGDMSRSACMSFEIANAQTCVANDGRSQIIS